MPDDFRQTLRDAGLSQARFARLAGITPRHMSRVFTGAAPAEKYRPLIRLIRVLTERGILRDVLDAARVP